MKRSPQIPLETYRWWITGDSGTPILQEGIVRCKYVPEVIPIALESIRNLGLVSLDEKFKLTVCDDSNTPYINELPLTLSTSKLLAIHKITESGPRPYNSDENTISLYDWQNEAIEVWVKNDCRGVVEAATGTGKTLLALECARYFKNNSKKGVVCIVVPTIAIFDQWGKEARAILGLAKEEIARMGAKHHDRLKPQTKLLLAVQQSAISEDATYGCQLLKELIVVKRPVLLVFDEVHHIAANQTFERLVKYMPESFSTLGLSATPNRRDGRMAKVYQYFDKPEAIQPIYTYGLMEAVDDGVLSKVNQHNYFVGLDHLEWSKWMVCMDTIEEHKRNIIYHNILKLDEDKVRNGDIGYLQDKLEDIKQELENRNSKQAGFRQHDQRTNKLQMLRKEIEELLQAYISRRRVLNKAACKWGAIRYLFNESSLKDVFRSGKWVFFHQEIEECHQTAKLLREIVDKNQVAEHHSQIGKEERNQALEALNRGDVKYLCAVETLDEGVNVPTLDGAVIVSGAVSKLQQVQRCGRALRTAPGKKVAYLVFLLVKGDDDNLGEKPPFDDEEKRRNWQKSVIELPFPRFGEYDL